LSTWGHGTNDAVGEFGGGLSRHRVPSIRGGSRSDPDTSFRNFMQPSRNLIPSRSRGINYSGDVVEEWRIQADRQHGGGERQTPPHGQDEPARSGVGKRGGPQGVPVRQDHAVRHRLLGARRRRDARGGGTMAAEIGPRRVAPEHYAERLMGLRKDTEGGRWVPTASCLEVDLA
jgi:hypothetical protein